MKTYRWAGSAVFALGMVFFSLFPRVSAAADPTPPGRRIHERTGAVRMRASASRTFLFYTPEGERAWAGESWDPRTVCSKNGRDEEGLVFRNGTGKPLWVVTRLDPAARVVEYVISSSDVVTVLHIEVAASGENESTATVSYQWLPRTEAGEEWASEHDRHFTPMLGSWQEAMNAILAGKPAASR